LHGKRERWNLIFLDYRKSASDLEEVFQRHNDRYWGGYSGARNTLIFPLRSPGGEILGRTTLRSAEEGPYLSGLLGGYRGSAAGLLALGLAVLLGTVCRRWLHTGDAGGGGAAAAFLAGTILLWLIRMVLSRGGFPQRIWELEAFDFSTFASRRLFDLISSPADLFLTAVVTVLQALLLALLLRHLARRWERPETTGVLGAWSAVVVLGLLATAVALGNGFGRVVRHVVSNSRIDLLSVELTSPGLDRLLILGSLLLLLLALLWILAAMAAVAGSRLGWPTMRPVSPVGLPGGLSLRVALLPAVGLATLVLYPILLHANSAALSTFFVNNLKPQVLDHRGLREAALARSMETVAGDPRLGEQLAHGTVQDGTGAAFDTWLRTALADEGFDSSVMIIEAGGVPIGRFSLNMPFLPSLDAMSRHAPELPRKEIFQGEYGQEEVLHGAVEVRYRGMTVGLAVLHVVDRYHNLPFLTSIDPYTRIFRSVRRRAPEKPAAVEPVLFVYTASGEGVPAAGVSPPALPEALSSPLPPEGEWHAVPSADGSAVQLLFFQGPGEIFALGYPAPGWLDRLGGFVRLLLLFETGGFLVLLAGFLVSALNDPFRLHPSTLVEYLGRSYYRKLLASFLVASLAPLLVLAVFLEGMVNREIRKEIAARGRHTLESARAILSSAATMPDGTRMLVDDGVVGTVTDLVGQDLNLYLGERLQATSRRELVASGLLTSMLPGPVYRGLFLEGREYVSTPVEHGAVAHTLLATALPEHVLGERAALTLALGVRPGEVEARVAQVGEAILIATVTLVVLLALTGYMVARRFAAPIGRLVDATGLLARGKLDTQVIAETRDETARLVYSFNAMARALRDQQEALRKERDYIEKILENATTGVVTLDGNTIVKINPAAAEMLRGDGLPRNGMNLRQFLAGDAGLQEISRAFEEAGDPPHPPYRFEVTVSRQLEEASEDQRRLRSVLLPFAQEDQQGRILLLEDITDVVRSNRLLAWAEMARRIAHEIKNPLTPIQLSAQHLQRLHAQLGPECLPDEFAASLDECTAITLQQVTRLREISAEFSTYARIPEIQLQPTDPAQFLEEVLHPYAVLLPDNVRLERRVEPGLPLVPLDANLMKRILVNLVENSLQAMPDGGTLLVAASRCSHNGCERLELSVSDTGSGVPQEDIDKMFEPYFSTKEHGTGLGLSIARKAVEEHGGTIRAERRAEQGTTLRIWLPLETDDAAGDATD
jgi:signal transduction histidine kinase